MGKTLKTDFTKDDVRMTHKHIKCIQYFLAIWKMWIKTTVRYYNISMWMTKIKKKKVITSNVNQHIEKLDFSYLGGGNAKWYRHSGKQFGNSLQK